MSTCEGDDNFKNESNDKNKSQASEFRLGVSPFDPLHVIVALVYAATR